MAATVNSLDISIKSGLPVHAKYTYSDKRISTGLLPSSLFSSLLSGEKAVRTGYSNYKCLHFRFENGVGSREWVSFESPAVWPVKYLSSKITIELPYVIMFGFPDSDGSSYSYSYIALTNVSPVEPSFAGLPIELYELPMPNISHGHICWGGNNPMVTEPHHVLSMIPLFFGSKFNNDMSSIHYNEYSTFSELYKEHGPKIKIDPLLARRIGSITIPSNPINKLTYSFENR